VTVDSQRTAGRPPATNGGTIDSKSTGQNG
jgi:hypothetical protein